MNEFSVDSSPKYETYNEEEKGETLHKSESQCTVRDDDDDYVYATIVKCHFRHKEEEMNRK
jgi:hypothetical protein